MNCGPNLPLVAMYMAIGAESAMQKLSGDAYKDLVDEVGGHLGVMSDFVLEIAKHVATRLDERGEIDNWPGVFAYEVSEPLGAEIIEHAMRVDAIEYCKTLADEMIETFFKQGN